MITMEYANSFGLAAFGQVTLEKITTDIDAIEKQTATPEQLVAAIVNYLMTMSESDRKIALGIIREEVLSGRDQLIPLAEVEKRIAEAERGVFAKYWWLWTLLGVVGVTGFGLIVYRTMGKRRRRR